MEKVVYLLGAGFSRHAGLPLMGNFLERSKDLYFANPDKFKDFPRVFSDIDRMAKCKNIFDTDLSNIEDILSILEMQESLTGESSERSFINYICDVIDNTTIQDEACTTGGAWQKNIFGNHPLAKYRGFVACLLGYNAFHLPTNPIHPAGYNAVAANTSGKRYSVITLNYDQVLERAANLLTQRLGITRKFRMPGCGDQDDDHPWLVKLHGCVSNRDIIPPTWSKGLVSKQIREGWREALRLLSEANYIRIIGYSLPPSDSYIKYLLRAAMTASDHLKRLDVLCLDVDGSAKRRYDDFITFKNYTFRGDVLAEDYLGGCSKAKVSGLPKDVQLKGLEETHNDYFDEDFVPFPPRAPAITDLTE